MTERTVAKQSLLNDDAISINSTETEAFSEDEEFEVERVMAEKVVNGRKYYLIAWLGYPEWKSTWEPKKHIRDQTILNTWKERKMREESGIDQPYDVARFEDMINRLAAEKAGRRRLRKAKRKRLGIPVSPSEASLRRSSDSESSIEAMEVNDDLEDDPGMKRTRINNSRTLRKPKKPSQVLVRGANVQPLEDNPPGDDVSQRTRRKKQDGTSRESVDAALPASEKVPVEGDSRPGRYGGTTHAASSKLPEVCNCIF
jgi:chromo domain-containing protein 1